MLGKKGKIAIVCDNYKLSRFKEELDKKKYVYTTQPFPYECTTITVLTYDQKGIAEIVQNVEGCFNDRKAANN